MSLKRRGFTHLSLIFFLLWGLEEIVEKSSHDELTLASFRDVPRDRTIRQTVAKEIANLLPPELPNLELLPLMR